MFGTSFRLLMVIFDDSDDAFGGFMSAEGPLTP